MDFWCNRKRKRNLAPSPLLHLLPSADLKSTLSHTDRETEKAWSAVKITNFRLPGFMMPGWSVDGNSQVFHCSATIIQSQSSNSWCARAPPPQNKITSWNTIKCGSFGNPEDSWFNSVHFPHSKTRKSNAQKKKKWELGGKWCKWWQRTKLLLQSPAGMAPIPGQLTSEMCCLMSEDHVLQWNPPRGPKGTSRPTITRIKRKEKMCDFRLKLSKWNGLF